MRPIPLKIVYGMEPSRTEDYDAVRLAGDSPALGPEGRPLGRRSGRRVLPPEPGRRLPPVSRRSRRGRGRPRVVLPRSAPGRPGLRHGPGAGPFRGSLRPGLGSGHQPADAGRRGRPAIAPRRVAASELLRACVPATGAGAGAQSPRPAPCSRAASCCRTTAIAGSCPCSARSAKSYRRTEGSRSSTSSMPSRGTTTPRIRTTRPTTRRSRSSCQADEAGFRRSTILGEPDRRVLLLLAER